MFGVRFPCFSHYPLWFGLLFLSRQEVKFVPFVTKVKFVPRSILTVVNFVTKVKKVKIVLGGIVRISRGFSGLLFSPVV
jgi:hypothetical protein